MKKIGRRRVVTLGYEAVLPHGAYAQPFIRSQIEKEAPRHLAAGPYFGWLPDRPVGPMESGWIEAEQGMAFSIRQLWEMRYVGRGHRTSAT